MSGTLGQVEQEQRIVFELANMPEGWLRVCGLLLLTGLAYAVVWLYQRESRAGAGLRVRMVLAALRCAVLVVLAVVFLEPVLATYTRRIVRSSVVVLVDRSASMSILDAASDEAGEQTRRSRQEQVLALLAGDGQRWLRRLAERNQLAVYAFGDQTMRIGAPPVATAQAPHPAVAVPTFEQLRDELRADRPLTNLADAVSAVLDDHADQPVAAVVVISDGQFNAGAGVEDLIARLRSARTQVFAVGVGQAQEPPNVRVAGVSGPTAVALGDPFELRVELAATAILPTTVQLELAAEQPGSAGEPSVSSQGTGVVARREVKLGGPQTLVEVRIPLEARTAGETVYRARVLPLEVEAVQNDNEAGVSVRVLDEKLRVLLVAGRPTFDYRFLTALLVRDRTIDVSCWLQSADPQAVRDGDTILTALPRTPEELFDYDAIVLLDPDPRELDSTWALTVRRLVDELGGGLLYQAGPQYAARFLGDARLDELIRTLPITPDPDASVRLSEQGTFQTRAMPAHVPPETADHPLLRLTDARIDVAAYWAALPPFWWHYPVLREKALATVLLRAGSAATAAAAQPVLAAVQPFGSGRVMYIGFDGSWRWRATAEEAFNRFWVQAIRYLAHARRQGMAKRGVIELDRQRYAPGDIARVEARVLDEAFAPLPAARVTAELDLPAGVTRALELTAVPGREGWFAGRLPIDWTGLATLRIPLTSTGDSAGAEEPALRRHLYSQPDDLERRSLRLNVEQLTKLADETGGLYVPIADAQELPDWIENADQIRTSRGVDRPLWDRAWLLMALAAALATEWTVRRRTHLL